MQTPHTALVALRPIGCRPAAPPRQGNLPSLSAPRGREPSWLRCFLRPVLSAPLDRLGTRLSPTVAMLPPTGSGPGLKSEGDPDAPDASERPAWPCLTDASTLAAPMALCSLGSW
jgi:hypothetical protein